jgi:hypothetical protein
MANERNSLDDLRELVESDGDGLEILRAAVDNAITRNGEDYAAVLRAAGEVIEGDHLENEKAAS